MRTAIENRQGCVNIRLPSDGRRSPAAFPQSGRERENLSTASCAVCQSLVGSDAQIACKLVERTFLRLSVVGFANITLVPPPTALPEFLKGRAILC